ncbi:MAG: hypothetical protein IJX47_06435 [Clostridia bacterium]|nr:hypothetical protein [Clostridia bacterium]MBQ8382821.1 hypothetical protein [Clostridia bacterium]
MTDRIEALLSDRDFADAIELLEQIPEKERDARWYYLRYLGQEGLEQHYEALLSLKAACERDPDHPVYQKNGRKRRNVTVGKTPIPKRRRKRLRTAVRRSPVRWSALTVAVSVAQID